MKNKDIFDKIGFISNIFTERIDKVELRSQMGIGQEIIRTLGTSVYMMWKYLEGKNFIYPSMDQMVKDLGRSSRTIRGWIRKLESEGYV